MKRLTKRDDTGHYITDKTAEMTWNSLSGEIRHRGYTVDRLAAIEDILGDEYELDRLKELVEADKDGRCVVFSPGYPVVSTYHKDEDGMAIREVAGAVSAEEYDAALKAREQDEQ